MAANANSASDPKNNSVRSFLTSLALNGGLLVVQVGVFIIIKSKLARIYSPRSYIPPPDRRAESLSSGPWRWLPQTLVTPSKSIIHKNGLDAYMSIRFLQMMMKIFTVCTLVTWPVLLPLNSSGMPSTQSDGLGRLGFGNINRTSQGRYWVHLIVAFGLTGFVLWLMRRELLIFVHLRHQFLVSRSHAKLSQARTVLITDLPMELANEDDLRQLFSFVPGGISRVWIYRNEPGLPRLFDERADACIKLERGLVDLLQTAIKARAQQEAKAAKLRKQQTKGKRFSFPLGVRATVDDENLAADLEKSGPAKLLENIHRPMHRLGWVPFVGKKVDTIDHCTERIAQLNVEIEDSRKKLPDCKPFGAAFIECELQIGAHVMAQCVSYHEPLFMSQRWTEVSPEDVVWANIDDGAYEVRSRYVLSWAATFALIVLWGFPVALAGFTSNVSQACADHAWLAWICRTSPVVQGIIQGVFPPLLLAVLFLILPYLLHGLAWFENIPRYSLISISVYKRYFMFLVIHGFLIITFFSSLSSVLKDLQNPTKMVQNFAIYLPNASTFFLTYMLQQGLMGAAGALLQIGPLILYFIKKLFFGSTPREAYQATFFMPHFDFGVMLPRMSLLATIGLAYSIISPIINLLALATFALFFVAWKFLLIWVLDQPDAQETSGLYFPLLMSNLFTGLYIQHICLMGLFFFAINDKGEHTSIPEGAIMVVLIVLTAAAQIFFKHAFTPVIKNLPMSLSTKKLAARFAKERQATRDNGDAKDGKGEVYDLFSRRRVRSVVRHRLRLREPSGHHSRAPRPEERQEKKEKAEADRIATEEEKRKDFDKAAVKAQEILEEPSESAPRASIDSKGSKGSGKKKSGFLGALASATPEGIKIDAAAPALVDRDGDGIAGESDSDEYLEDHAFDHPSTYQTQQWIWLPKWPDHPELSKTLVDDIKAAKVDAADEGATIDDSGNVHVSRGPPDEAWDGGHDV